MEDCFAKIDEIFIKTAQSVQRVIINDKHCFELYGYDILLDSELKPCVSSKIHLSALHCCCNSYYIKFALCHAGGSLKSTHLRRLLQAVKKIMTSSLGCLMTSSTWSISRTGALLQSIKFGALCTQTLCGLHNWMPIVIAGWPVKRSEWVDLICSGMTVRFLLRTQVWITQWQVRRRSTTPSWVSINLFQNDALQDILTLFLVLRLL